MMQKFTGKVKEHWNSLKRDKRGSLPDVIFGGSYLLRISITIILCIFIWLSFKNIMTTTIIGAPSESILNSVMTTLTNAYYSMDYMFPFVVGGLLLISTVFAYKTGSNILLGAISFIFWVIALILSALFVNVYLTVTDQFPSIYVGFPVMDIIMSNLHFFTLGWLVVLTLVMFRKNNKEDTSQVESRFYAQ